MKLLYSLNSYICSIHDICGAIDFLFFHFGIHEVQNKQEAKNSEIIIFRHHLEKIHLICTSIWEPLDHDFGILFLSFLPFHQRRTD